LEQLKLAKASLCHSFRNAGKSHPATLPTAFPRPAFAREIQVNGHGRVLEHCRSTDNLFFETINRTECDFISVSALTGENV
jgi:hypothetical protein